MIRPLSALLCAALASPATAQSDAPLDFLLTPILALAGLAHLDRSGLRRALEDVLPITVTPEPIPNAPLDPFLWSLSGSFGGTGAHPRPGAIFGCARYGIATRDTFLQHGLASTETFTLMRYARPQFDDTQA